jgi:hypothetical protein
MVSHRLVVLICCFLNGDEGMGSTGSYAVFLADL